MCFITMNDNIKKISLTKPVTVTVASKILQTAQQGIRAKTQH